MAHQEIEAPVTLRQLAMVKSRWGIAISALVRRCYDLRLIDEARRLSLEKQISTRGWRKNEPVEVTKERPAMVERALELVVGGLVQIRPLPG